ncbi:MAG: PSD1 and planctomycete cytochrome C domain-containing protein [Planctomycetota bacterium]|nr:PSD1 and planctomycete cytochrome C domain-containing protein [Planctomycetota bacterium]
MPVPFPKWTLVATVAAVMVTSARAAEPPSAAGLAFFEKQIRPLLVRRCYACHSARAGKAGGGLMLDEPSGWEKGGSNGAAVVAGDVEASLLIAAVRYDTPDLRMPPDKPLTNQEITRLEHWVRMGAPAPVAVDNKPTVVDPADPVAGRTHWAFRPLQRVLPAGAPSNWSGSMVDRFVRVGLEAAQLEPAVPASRWTLARRLYLQLIGLPPTPNQVARYVDDSHPDASDRLVDQLLASPQFGERWGRHWLDLARYADSNGLDENFLFREAWRYRNWVIDAVNGDQGFDRFVLEQVAGDLLPHESIEQRDRQRIASGFLVLGPKVLLGNDAKERRMDVADEQLDTIGRTFLGQTLGCARCHDHKFDPVPTADYYALAGVLTSTVVMEQRYMLGSQRLMERLAGLGPAGAAADDAYETYWRERPDRLERLKQAKAALELVQAKDAKGLAELARKHADSVAEMALDANNPFEVQVKAQQKRVQMLARSAEAPAIPPRAMIATDAENPADEAIRLAGRFDDLGTVVPRGFLRVIGTVPRAIPADHSGRLELAQWLIDPQVGAGQLTARVLANRLWHHVFGRGIVRTVDNFGRTGEAPSHPELLDYLGLELLGRKWSLKSLVRQLVTSQTFGMSSRADVQGNAVDPENRLHWRAHRRRLRPEAMRDAMLLVAGQLDLTPMMSSVWYLGDQATAVGANTNRRRTDFPCRSVYLPVIRNDLPELFEVFDFANPHTTTGLRPQTLVAPQGLYLLNEESVMTAAAATAKRVLREAAAGGSDGVVDALYQWVFTRRPTTAERQEVLTFIEDVTPRLATQGEQDPVLQAWSLACHALFASSRFQLVE